MSASTMPPLRVTAVADAEDRAGPGTSMIERMTAIMDSFDRAGDRLALEDVTARTGLPRSTAHRILDRLVRLGWLDRDTRGYGIGPRPRSLAGCDHDHLDVRQLAAPVLHELQLATGMVVHLAVLEGGHVHYLDKMGGRFATAVPSRVGGRASAHATALGKAMLAWLPAEDVDVRLREVIGRHTPRTIADLPTLHQELHRIRARHGLAFERGECFPDIACVASAIRGPEGPVGAISLVGDARSPLERVAPLVSEATRRISAGLGVEAAAWVEPDPVAELPEDTWSAQTLDRLLASGGGWL